MIPNWSEESRKSELFSNKRLSEIARIILSDYVIISDADRAIGTRCLAFGWLDIVENHKNQYGQQKIDAA